MPKDVRGEWTVVQSNGFQMKIDVEGQADVTCEGKADMGGTLIDLANARATDDEFVFTVDGPGPFKWRYSGRFDLEGNLAGVTFDENNPLAQATWVCPDKRFGQLA